MNETYFKIPVHEVVAALPTGKSAGYRCILTTDGLIYTYGADGNWTADSDIAFGSQANVIGLGGIENQQATYLNAHVYYNRRSPYFMVGNDKNVLQATYIANQIAAIRSKEDNSSSDCLYVDPNGDTFINAFVGNAFKSVKDSLANLWFASKTVGLRKIENGERAYYNVFFSTTDNNLPFDTITDIIADGIELWIIYANATELKIAHYDGYVWEDLTSQMETDLTASGLDCDKLTAIKYYGLAVDGERVMFSFTDASVTGNLFYYDKADKTFYKKTLASAFTGKFLQKLIKIGDNVYCTVSSAAAPGDGKVWVWSWSLGTALFTGTTDDMTDIVTNGTDIIIWRKDKLQKITYPDYTPVDATSMEAGVLSKLTNGATLALVDVAMNVDGRICFLNKWDSGDSGSDPLPGPWENNVIEAVPSSGWVVSSK